MKIALYIEDGLEQIVLTPTSTTEDGILGKLHDGSRQLSIKRGEFYGCRGGWTRHKKQYHSPYGSDEPNDESTIIVLTVPAPAPPIADPAETIAKIEAEARRYAEMYPQYSDGRNSFTIFADWVASLALSSKDSQ